jgi:hypothetical protein
MYQSQQYLEIGGKFICCPFSENDSLHGVCLYSLVCQLHESGAKSVTDFKTVLLSAIECKIGLHDMKKARAVYKRVMQKLKEAGVNPLDITH